MIWVGVTGWSRSERHLRSDDHGAVPREPEGLDRAGRVAGHRDEQSLPQQPEGRRVRRSDRDPREEVLGVLEVEAAFEQSLPPAQLESGGDVQLLLIADS